MKKTVSLLAYHARVYVRTNRYVMPFVALVVLLAGVYAVAPVRVVDSYAFSMCILFAIMVWAGLTYPEIEDPVSEQLLILKTGSAARFYLSQTLFLACVGLAFSLIAAVFPQIVQAIRGDQLYKTPAMLGDVLFAFALHGCVAFMGTAVGALFHPRIIVNRKYALLLAMLVSLVGLVKIGLHRMLPFTAAVTWVFPPISDIAETFAGQLTFAWRNVGFAAGVSVLYGAVLTAIRIALLLRKKF